MLFLVLENMIFFSCVLLGNYFARLFFPPEHISTVHFFVDICSGNFQDHIGTKAKCVLFVLMSYPVIAQQG